MFEKLIVGKQYFDKVFQETETNNYIFGKKRIIEGECGVGFNLWKPIAADCYIGELSKAATWLAANYAPELTGERIFLTNFDLPEPKNVLFFDKNLELYFKVWLLGWWKQSRVLDFKGEVLTSGTHTLEPILTASFDLEY
ncbi:hypothetical protein COS93_02835 [bacterium (Candidatus Gribaldobacteria) CG07_land_8_20_14_0_80_33_18]|uniref:Uncharacterized protein n=1 Tax=bacterium (Candidatus Gribaldobacteria) CG07_land_8_20_14_0_80_33_18 TaxID=2014272 RepID=A0A2M6Z1T4_9BACT|nr:MAG: hypothetical protein COU04_00135 [bacterium (Candidatus Gribaldobacteria) CG10_big_fil_rev_8_21_14_0_10_33_41]PIU46346.1 MAG: hypothetical protein COS93_02835 [bacterium (Candidatus Gribaldobacteria) CG07_land_8_20_14_0_80_33_18]PJB09060.1 MAG: hypothetical protein CO122_00085 [bacterium (Candidatus Gribaldobacteria) CG_4_9_14_3_um_filter_33_9]